MRGYLHEHLNYDEIIDDTQSFEYSPKTKQRDQLLKLTSKEGKPFWLEKDEEVEQENRKRKLQAIKLEAMQKYDEKQNTNKQDSYEQYENDFEEFTESFYESIAKQSRKPSSLLDYQEVNLSAQMPTAKKIHLQPRNSVRYETTCIKKTYRPANLSNSQRKTVNNRNRQAADKINRSTIDLKKDNRSMLQRINHLKELIPQYRKNSNILLIQKHKIQKLKQFQMRVFDADYEYSLDKAVEKSSSLQIQLKKALQKKERKIKRNDRHLVAQKNKFTSPVVEEEIPEKVFIVREELMCKMREDIHNQQKILELDKKIMQYQNVMRELDEKIMLGSFEELEQKKQRLKNENIIKKTEWQTKKCEIMGEITQINQKISNFQIQIMKAGKELKKTFQNHEKLPEKTNNLAVEKSQIYDEGDNPEDLNRTSSKFRISAAPKNQKFLKFFKARR